MTTFTFIGKPEKEGNKIYGSDRRGTSEQELGSSDEITIWHSRIERRVSLPLGIGGKQIAKAGEVPISEANRRASRHDPLNLGDVESV